MSGNLNRVELIGNVSREPESRTTQAGSKVVSFSLATNERWKDRDGNQKERAEFHRIVIFNEHIAKVAELYVHKGSLLYISGQLSTRKWTDKDGVEKYTTEIVIPAFRGELLLLGSKSDNNDQSGGRRSGNDEAPLDDEEIPF